MVCCIRDGYRHLISVARNGVLHPRRISTPDIRRAEWCVASATHFEGRYSSRETVCCIRDGYRVSICVAQNGVLHPRRISIQIIVVVAHSHSQSQSKAYNVAQGVQFIGNLTSHMCKDRQVLMIVRRQRTLTNVCKRYE